MLVYLQAVEEQFSKVKQAVNHLSGYEIHGDGATAVNMLAEAEKKAIEASTTTRYLHRYTGVSFTTYHVTRCSRESSIVILWAFCVFVCDTDV